MQFSVLAILSLAASAIAAPSHMTRRQDTAYTIQACKDLNLEGQCTELEGLYGACTNVPANFNGVISSVTGDSETECFAFKETDCTGAYFVMPANTVMARIPADMNDSISSVIC